MNQKAVIYIILSAILLYLYYRKRDLAIFVAFVVVVTGTLILGKGGVEGFGKGGGGGGGGGGGDKECAKLGFKEVKIDKKNINDSLKKIFSNFKTVTSKYITYDESPVPKKEYRESLRALEKFEIIKSEMDKIHKVKENGEYMRNIMFGSVSLLHTYLINPQEESRTTFMEQLKKFKEKDDKGRTPFELVLKGGELGSKVLEKIKKSDELKESDKEVKKVFSVIHCTFKHVLTIWKALDKVVVEGDGGDEGGNGDDEDGKGKDEGGDGQGDDDGEKKTKKKKKVTKKKKNAADDEDADANADDE